jgi:hypothetical protein
MSIRLSVEFLFEVLDIFRTCLLWVLYMLERWSWTWS